MSLLLLFAGASGPAPTPVPGGGGFGALMAPEFFERYQPRATGEGYVSRYKPTLRKQKP